ncbi:hypothetical protein [Cyclobacterium jeungdonense]|uniref:Uncharacterized protein n=1 Tax=Cyclobacterium jeungdonense TaxID=708087 RepID=A0ABT8C405_9BACT|nr:hypothetical protein [Cyclobacterium jeungdonense]MDN3686490.1 hypothetical protein [Cyclobacterium jeungdonense]
MGFVPIFITLGGFVFLFILLVHQNIRQKKDAFSSTWKDLEYQLQQHQKTPPDKLAPGDLEGAEKTYRSLQKSAPEDDGGQMDSETFNELLLRLKRSRYEYNNLVRMRPYSFVANLFGHRPL